MRVERIHANEVPPDLRAQWHATLSCQADFANPFFNPLFTESVGDLCPDVFVALLETDGQLGFFPFELNGTRTARPPGGKLCDYQGVIAPAGLNWTAQELLRGCHIDRYHYKRMLCSQKQFKSYHTAYGCSALIDLQEGFEAYSRKLEARGSALIKKVMNYRKKLERDHGPLRYQASCHDENVFEWLRACKSAQYIRTGLQDRLQIPWIVRLLRQLHAGGTPEFGGMLSVLWAGDEIAAAHFGLRAKAVLHYWFPGYNLAFKNYSPGLILLLELARNADRHGTFRIDLGRADAPYKRRFMSGGNPIAEGIAISTDSHGKE